MRWIAGLSLAILVLLAFSPATAQDDDICLACHDDQSLSRVEGGIARSLYVGEGMIPHSVHDGLSCTDCHTALAGVDDFPHAPHLPGVTCSDCHEDAFETYMVGFRDHLIDRGFPSVPGCTSCHGTHEITNLADTRAVCGICHNQKRQEFEQSVHGQIDPTTGLPSVSCTSCHDAHDKTRRGKMLPKDWRLDMVNNCLECHKDQSHDYIDSRHYAEVKRGNSRAPICVDCHSAHAVFDVEDRRSAVHIDRLDNTCDSCHPGHAASIHRRSDADPRLMTCVACHTGHVTDMTDARGAVFKETLPSTCNRCHGEVRHEKENMAHGRVMLFDDEGGEANCSQCHVYHWKMSDSAHAGKAKERLACINCHASENSDWEKSAHGIAYRKGHTEAPTCVTCHGERNVERISSQFTGQSIVSLCGSCHSNREITMRFQLNPNVVKGYLSTYHGQAYTLGYQGEKFATCVSCHDNHLILPRDNPESTISRQHIIDTCGRCHKDANVNFVSQLQHYDPMAGEDHPILDIIHVGMVWLLRITLTIFGIHTILWLVRAWVDRIRHGKPKKIKAPYRFRRFGVWERFLHALVMVSFLMLAMTGLPLKYSHSEASQWIAANLLDLRTMAIMHRIGATITFAYFAMHLLGLVMKVARKKYTLKELFWGENSLVPQPRDAVQFAQHVGYFIGLSQKPKFGRWTYWEKFDYMAVFWGVAVIGASGLTLWFPEFFTRLLPGWIINAAHIIHSEEALLATGFIFTIHFFNEHLRPDNFPFDEVIFTGSLSAHYMLEERAGWYEKLKEEGKIEQIKVKPMHILPRTLLYIFGFAALAVGVGLLTLIVIGTFTGTGH